MYFWEEKQNDNPFRGKDGLLSLYRVSPNVPHALRDIKTNDDIKLFWRLIFRIGDIRRQHNLLKETYSPEQLKEMGLGDGIAARREFHKCLLALKENHYADLVKLLPLIHEFTNWENILYAPNKTNKQRGKKAQVIEEYPPVFSTTDIVTYIKSIWDDLNFTKRTLLMKFMPRIPRKKNNPLPETIKRNAWNSALIREFCDQFDMTPQEYTKLRSEYVQNTEAVKFSVPVYHKSSITKMTVEEFKQWIEHLPAGQRQRVYNRCIKNPDKWKIADGSRVLDRYQEFQNKKGDLNNRRRELEAKKRIVSMQTRGFEVSYSVALDTSDTIFTIEDQQELLELESMTQVTVGANSTYTIMGQWKKGKLSKTEVNNMMDTIMRDMHSDVMALPIIDVSVSMGGITDNGLERKEVAVAYATLLMIKNMSDLFFTFDSNVRVMAPGVTIGQRPVSTYFRNTTGPTMQLEDFINPAEGFMENYNRVLEIVNKFSGGATYFDLLADYLVNYFDRAGINLAEKYPVIVVFSDTELNGTLSGANGVAATFVNTMKTKLGWNGILFLWDIHSSRYGSSNNFKDIGNVVYTHGNSPDMIDNLIKGILNVKMVDGYAPLVQVAADSRYDIVDQYLN